MMAGEVTIGWLIGVAISAVGASAAISLALYKLLKDHLDAQIKGQNEYFKAEHAAMEKRINTRIDGLERNVNTRIDALEKSVTTGSEQSNRRFDDLNRRVDDTNSHFASRIDDANGNLAARIGDVKDEVRKLSQDSRPRLQAAQSVIREPAPPADSSDAPVAQRDASSEAGR